MLMHQLLYDGAKRHPDRLAFRWVDRDKALTFAEATVTMERFAGALHHLGVRKGDRVTIFAHNGMDYLIGLFACWRIGAIAALVNIRFADELDYYFADHEPSVVIYTHDMLEPVRAAAANAPSVRALVCMDGPQPGAESLPALLDAGFAPPPDPADEDSIAHLSYTSGTTGKPKGACLAHEPTVRAANCIAERLRITSDDVSFGPTALSKIAIVTLPTVNLYLQDRGSGRTPRWRGVTLVHEMRRRGIVVAAAGDNCRDCFYAYGDHDMVDTFRQAVRILHLDHPLAEAPTLVGPAPATIARLSDHGRIQEGAPARLLVFNARTLNEVVSRPHADRIVIDSGRRSSARAPDYSEMWEAATAVNPRSATHADAPAAL